MSTFEEREANRNEPVQVTWNLSVADTARLMRTCVNAMRMASESASKTLELAVDRYGVSESTIDYVGKLAEMLSDAEQAWWTARVISQGALDHWERGDL